ncbi:hypothetical protein [Lapillicoccus sp.]|uniref:hypothetical protein n=1 Tax=Lapillicoccus sp. TaxID=1909287 RepID=UPI0025CCFAA4|nr:hypothetical protein [Lapillicoccus sp.]
MTGTRRTDIVARTRNHRLAARLGGAGAVAGVVAGLIQLTLGPSIPEWTGAKSSPGALGLLTMVLSLLAGLAALRQRDANLSTGHRTAYAAIIIATALLCFTTVGWLWWWLPAPLLFAAGSLTIDNTHDSIRAIRDNWARCLLTVLGGSEILMAAGAGPLLMAVGGLGGAVLVAVAWVPMTQRSTFLDLVLIGTVPFALLGWTAIAPILLMLMAVAIALPLVRAIPTRRGRPSVDVVDGPM